MTSEEILELKRALILAKRVKDPIKLILNTNKQACYNVVYKYNELLSITAKLTVLCNIISDMIAKMPRKNKIPDRMREICGNCGFMYGVHLKCRTEEHPEIYCPVSKNYIEPNNGSGVCFIPTGTYKEG